MSRKRNEYLDASESEDDIRQEPDVEEDTRFRALPTKRRKLNRAGSEGEVSASSESEQDPSDVEAGGAALSGDSRKNAAAGYSRATKHALSQHIVKPLSHEQLAASQAKVRKTGVIYISRIPPFMKPSAVRNLLSPYGTVLRIFLTPEPTPAYQKRVKAGGNRKRSFVDGWVEFASKKKAKIVAETLNGNIIGGKKGSWYHDDIWNIKYLKGFKWADLMEQVQNEEREREGRLRAEISKEAKERKTFLENLELQKRDKGMQEKRRKKREKGDPAVGDVDVHHAEVDGSRRKRGEMRFRQHEVKDVSKMQDKTLDAAGPGSIVSSKIFG